METAKSMGTEAFDYIRIPWQNKSRSDFTRAAWSAAKFGLWNAKNLAGRSWTAWKLFLVRFWKMDVVSYPRFSHMEANPNAIQRSKLEILSEIVLQLVIALWFISAYPIVAIVRKFFDVLVGENHLSSEVVEQAVKQSVLFPENAKLDSESQRRNWLSSLNVIQSNYHVLAHPASILLWILGVRSVSVEHTIYLSQNEQVDLELLERELPILLASKESNLSFPIFLSVLTARFLTRLVFTFFDFTAAWNQTPLLGEQRIFNFSRNNAQNQQTQQQPQQKQHESNEKAHNSQQSHTRDKKQHHQPEGKMHYRHLHMDKPIHIPTIHTESSQTQ